MINSVQVEFKKFSRSSEGINQEQGLVKFIVCLSIKFFVYRKAKKELYYE